MKKLFSTSLSQFVNDFNLSSINGVVCFPANVDFRCSFIVLKLFVDVHIISIDNLKMDVLYIMYSDKEQKKLDLPDMFSINDDITSYTKNEYLTIEGSSIIYGNYKLEIKPSKVKKERSVTTDK
jgi:hypothetical protein